MDDAVESSTKRPSASNTGGFHSTNPSGIDRLAEPDPFLAKAESSSTDKVNPAAAAPAVLRAANPDAEESGGL